VIAYATLRLGVDSYTTTLIPEPKEWNVLIEDMRAEVNISEEISKQLFNQWREMQSKYHPQTNRMHRQDQGRQRNITLSDVRKFYEFFGRDKDEGYQQSLCLTADVVYNWLIGIDALRDKSLEAFAGALNHRLNNWCGLFHHIEAQFGSLGSVFRLDEQLLNEFPLIISNPPYQNPVMERASALLSRLTTSSVSILPDWRSASTDFSRDIVLNNDAKPINRWESPYPAFEILASSPNYRGVISFGKMVFANDFGRSPEIDGDAAVETRIPDVSIIIVVLGDERIWESLLAYFT